MKKFFALAMATAMIASMAATSFAAVGELPGSADGFTTESKKGILPVTTVLEVLSYDSDDKVLVEELPEYGEVAHFALIQSEYSGGNATTDKQLVTESDAVSNLKLKTKWEEGSGIVDSVSIVKKKVSNFLDWNDIPSNKKGTLDSANSSYYKLNSAGTYDTVAAGTEDAIAFAKTLGLDAYGYAKDNYYYFLAVSLKSSTTTSDTDVIGTVTFNKSKDPKVDDLVVDVSMTVDWANSYRTATDFEVDGDVGPLKSETYYALKFSADDEVAIEFSDDSIFTVDVSGQSKLLVYYDTKYNSKIAAKYPLAELNFWNGNGAKFNRVGEMFIPVKEDYAQFLYQVNADGTLSEVTGAEYDKYDEGFYFYTRVLGTYVISDMELDLKPVVTTPAPEQVPVVTPPPAVTNPSTGAAA